MKLIDFDCKYCPGTPEYFPPEWYQQRQYMGRPLTAWTLGIVLYQLLHGDLPYLTKEDIVKGGLKFDPAPSKDCCEIISWCLKEEPKSRPTFKSLLRHKRFKAGQSYIERIPVIGHLAKSLQRLFNKK